ncbi:hypothetical protein FVEN_g7734 [Fusarium venenatum]|uniref:DUF2264 domain-containing protein n=1 Tax=Fusarium venenatum TaxID=56646 RepID=A0A2L2TIZ0_9HYPO|nr:uncharacterized protein FVRRES_08070 [Fusarium venenatum]KAG8354263.1 hypothetical protein FVEN_g7734 [Fusarium venenatum]KAH6964858.1 hypothetical protein EDB82DRAFT_578645 [Fusarium venenatum]CEI67993.1 unnamed protein product [Fusarium venenatum]
MSGLTGFTDNPFRNRSDLLRAAVAIVKPLKSYRSTSEARVKLYPSTAAGFDDVAAQLEGFARPLWAISALIDNGADPSICSWIKGIEAGVDPSSSEYWGQLGSFDQRMVEMESIAFALLTEPHTILSLLKPESVTNLERWLEQINNFTMPQNNWRWFRVLVNLALTKVLGSDKSAARHAMDADFAILDQFYLGEGWSSDGVWGDDRKQADYYSGSFAIQFAQLLYTRYADDDHDRVAKYRQQAIEFASEYWRYFDTNGAAIPFGRSMTYRFACGAFWAAFALANITSTDCLVSLGTVKGLLLRHLRWWSKQPEIFNSDGTMNIGFTYPNMYMSEDYNSRQSVYWCLKSFVVLGLRENHPFWTVEEESHPRAPGSNIASPLDAVKVFGLPSQIVCNCPEHHYLLSAGQMTTKMFKAREAKYGKFAYSSAFGYSVPTGPELHQLAPDSTLALSIDGGETWKVRWEPVDVVIGTTLIESEQGRHYLPSITSTWRPWKKLNMAVRTTLIPLASYYPGWHVRVHCIIGLETASSIPWCDSVELIDSSFAVKALTNEGYHVPPISNTDAIKSTDGFIADQSSVLVKSGGGASGIVDLTSKIDYKGVTGRAQPRLEAKGHLIAADPNTNLIEQRTIIPSIRYSHAFAGGGTSNSASERLSLVVVATAVFGVSSANIDQTDIYALWINRPGLKLNESATGTISIVII